MNPKKILTSLLILGLGLFSPAKVLADQYGQYGKAEEAAQISIDKKVKHPQSTTKGGEPVWVENLFADDYKFVPGEVVEFKLTIVNTGSIDLENVRVRDNLPGQLELVSGALDFTISKLESGQSYESDVIKARVKNNGQDGVYCLLNIGEVWADSQYDKDTAQICIEQKVLGMKEIPEAGPAENLALLLGSMTLALAGGVLLKKSY